MADCTTDWSNTTLATFNQTLLSNPSLCTDCTCPIELDGYHFALLQYYPSLVGNALYTAIFSLLLFLQLWFGIRHKTYGYMAAMVCGLLLEVLGYVSRILIRYNMFEFSYFVMYLVCLTIGPAFFSAAIYFTLSRIIVIYSPECARFRPQMYAYIFIACDVVALVLQASGGALAATAPADSAAKQAPGIDTMVAGVAWQVFSLALFGLLAIDYMRRVRQRGSRENLLNSAFQALREKPSFQPYFLMSLALSSLFIFVRCVFRCAELSGGFAGPLANEEIPYMVLEGAMIVLACGCLTVFHPGLIIGTQGWAAASSISKNVGPKKASDSFMQERSREGAHELV